jgi:hypothetical protein
MSEFSLAAIERHAQCGPNRDRCKLAPRRAINEAEWLRLTNECIDNDPEVILGDPQRYAELLRLAKIGEAAERERSCACWHALPHGKPPIGADCWCCTTNNGGRMTPTTEAPDDRA